MKYELANWLNAKRMTKTQVVQQCSRHNKKTLSFYFILTLIRQKIQPKFQICSKNEFEVIW